MITVGVALTQGNLGNRIKVRLNNGSIIYAIAQTNVVGGYVSVVQDERTKQWHCFSASAPISQINRTQKIYKSRPIETKKVVSGVAMLFSSQSIVGDELIIQLYVGGFQKQPIKLTPIKISLGDILESEREGIRQQGFIQLNATIKTYGLLLNNLDINLGYSYTTSYTEEIISETSGEFTEVGGNVVQYIDRVTRAPSSSKVFYSFYKGKDLTLNQFTNNSSFERGVITYSNNSYRPFYYFEKTLQRETTLGLLFPIGYGFFVPSLSYLSYFYNYSYDNLNGQYSFEHFNILEALDYAKKEFSLLPFSESNPVFKSIVLPGVEVVSPITRIFFVGNPNGQQGSYLFYFPLPDFLKVVACNRKKTKSLVWSTSTRVNETPLTNVLKITNLKGETVSQKETSSFSYIANESGELILITEIPQYFILQNTFWFDYVYDASFSFSFNWEWVDNKIYLITSKFAVNLVDLLDPEFWCKNYDSNEAELQVYQSSVDGGKITHQKQFNAKFYPPFKKEGTQYVLRSDPKTMLPNFKVHGLSLFV